MNYYAIKLFDLIPVYIVDNSEEYKYPSEEYKYFSEHFSRILAYPSMRRDVDIRIRNYGESGLHILDRIDSRLCPRLFHLDYTWNKQYNPYYVTPIYVNP